MSSAYPLVGSTRGGRALDRDWLWAGASVTGLVGVSSNFSSFSFVLP